MGNSEQGCVCMRTQERVRSYDTWRSPLLGSLEGLYHSGFTWAQGLCKILMLWDSKFDNLFKNPNRWQFFLSRDCEKNALEYLVTPTHRNLFKELEVDFSDPRNPIGAILGQFCQVYTDQCHDAVREIIEENDPKRTSEMLETIASDVFMVIEILVVAIFSFYTKIEIVLKTKENELKGVILSQVIHGELYRLVYDLSLVLHKSKSDTIVKACQNTMNIEIDKKVLTVLRQISICESPYDKLQYLYILKSYIDHKNLPSQSTETYIWKHIHESNVQDIFVHLHLIDIFSFDSIPSTLEMFSISLSKFCNNS